MQAVHRQHNTAADAAGLSPRGCGCRAACAQLPEGPGASTSRVADRGWCFGTVAWFKSLCVWAARAHQRAGSPGGGAATAASLPGWAARPTTVVSSGVLVGLGACALQPHGLSGSRVGGASEGAVVAAGGLRFGGQRHGPKLAGSWQLRHAHRVSVSGTQRLGCHSSLTQQASGLFVASSVARKPILPL